jgi:hypothetical protein
MWIFQQPGRSGTIKNTNNLLVLLVGLVGFAGRLTGYLR